MPPRETLLETSLNQGKVSLVRVANPWRMRPLPEPGAGGLYPMSGCNALVRGPPIFAENAHRLGNAISIVPKQVADAGLISGQVTVLPIPLAATW